MTIYFLSLSTNLCIGLVAFSAFVCCGVQSFTSPIEILSPYRSSALYSSSSGPIVFEISSPDDLKEFVLEDDRPAIIKVYAKWCKSCKQFDIRYRKVASTWGETRVSSPGGVTEFSESARFAQMEYEANEEMCKLLDATKVPYILIYKRTDGKVAGFACPPSKFQLLIDALHEHVPTNSYSLEESDPLIETPFESVMEMEHYLAEGSQLIDGIIPEMQQEAGVSTSFEEFCKEQSHHNKH